MSAGMFWIMSVGIVAAMAGFWMGRLSLLGRIEAGQSEGDHEGGQDEPESRITESKNSGNSVSESRTLEDKSTTAGTSESRASGSKRFEKRVPERRKIWRKTAERSISGRRHSGNEKRIPMGWAIGSPAEGRVSTYSEGSRRGAMVQGSSSPGLLYAPASGKITKLYPLGNQMILRTDFGVELLIRVGDNMDEFLGEYFRPRILQNEFVNKGKLLLEFDREGILSEGGNADISVSVTAAEDFDNITVTDREQVKTGEEILWVRDWAGVI